MKRTPYTLITGASAGLGKEFALQCAKRGMNLILLALPASNVQSLAETLQIEYPVEAISFEVDLTNVDALKRLVGRIGNLYRINFLINNAGIGGSSAFNDTAPDLIDQIIQVNVRGTAMLTRFVIPLLISNKKSYILNVASMAAFTPIAYKTVYPASKAFISSFFLGLREELREQGVSVSVVYPGPVMTNWNTSRRILQQGLNVKWSLLSTSCIVQIALSKTLKGQAVIIPGRMNQLNQYVLALLPREMRLRIVSRAVKKELQFSLRA